MKECFKNAQRLAWLAGLDYWEGYVACGIIPIIHAFNTYNGKVIDFTLGPKHKYNTSKRYTLRRRGNILGTIPDTYAYLGIKIPLDIIEKEMLKHKAYICLLDDWMCHHPLLNGNVNNGGMS